MKITKKMVALYLMNMSEEVFQERIIRDAAAAGVSFRMSEVELTLLENK